MRNRKLINLSLLERALIEKLINERLEREITADFAGVLRKIAGKVS